ncbi:MAG: pentapeptide repeat-containing protein [Bryobacteraceae bacterium]
MVEDRTALDIRKLRAEVDKLEAENRKLASENSGWGKFARSLWPVATGVLTALVGFIGLTYQSQQTAYRDREVFLKLLEVAARGESAEARIGAISALAQYWHGPFRTTVAEILSATLMTEAVKTGQADAESVRRAAAFAIGEAICDKPSPVSPWCVSPSSRDAAIIREILYGNSWTGRNGSVTRIQRNLAGQKQGASRDAAQVIELKLQATREAIRHNWENLQYGMFAEHDLEGIELYRGELYRAFFGKANLQGANLCRANLTEANIEGADLRGANLSGADLSRLSWNDATKLQGVNLCGVRNADPRFLAKASDQGAVTLGLDDWKQHVKDRLGRTLPAYTVYSECPLASRDCNH